MLTDKFRKGILRFLAAWFDDGLTEEDREDVAQEAILKAWRKLDQFRWGGKKGLFQWVARIAKNAALDWIERAGRAPIQVRDDMDAFPATDPPRVAVCLPRLRPVAKLLRELPRRERDAVTRVDIQGMSIQAAAEWMGVSYGAVAQARFRARRKIRALVTAHPEIIRKGNPFMGAEAEMNKGMSGMNLKEMRRAG